MQIQNERYYGNEHTHHITECLHEDRQQRLLGASAGIKMDTFTATDSQGSQSEGEPYGYYQGAARERNPVKRGLSLVRGLWESLGNQGVAAENRTNISMDHRTDTALSHRAIRSSMDAATSIVRQDFPYRIINKWVYVREKIKVGVHTALKRFNRGEESFAALSDPGSRSGQNRNGKQFMDMGSSNGTRRRNQEPITYLPADTYLMDSYSKTGEYCRINENITYQKPRQIKETSS